MSNSTYHDLLVTHAAYLRRAGYVEASSIALRTRSERLRDVISYVATFDRFTYTDLKCLVSSNGLRDIQFRCEWLSTLGRVVALQSFQKSDPESHAKDIAFALHCLEIGNRQIPADREHSQFHRLEIELLIEKGNIDQAAKFISSNEHLQDYYYGYLSADLLNPSISRTDSTYANWLREFNRPFYENDLLPVVPKFGNCSFDALDAPIGKTVNKAPLVSVILTSYKPELHTLSLAVTSILKQTWRNLELIIVDDASPSEFDKTLSLVENMDSRIRVLRLHENGGTYRARNIGLKYAQGELITGQDSDDWSHPERIAKQVEFLEANSDTPGVLVEAIRTDENLIRTFPGRLPQRPCEVSLMLPRSLAEDLGGYIDARKGADSEFRLRLEHYVDKKVEAIDQPLYLTRIGHDSLSNTDFKPGWSHPARRSFWNASRFWHVHTPPGQLSLDVSSRSPLPVPNRFRIQRHTEKAIFDVVFIHDWRANTGSQRNMIDGAKALLKSGVAVGVMHLESIMSPSKETTRLSTEIQELINTEQVTEIVPDDGIRTRLVVLNDPMVLQFAASQSTNLQASKILVAPELYPFAGQDEEVYYDVLECQHIAQELLGGEVLWTSMDPQIWAYLKSLRPEINVSEHPMPIALFPEDWENSRPRLLHSRPIIARHSENYPAFWPRNPDDVRMLWPTDTDSDVRILGDVRALHRKMGQNGLSSNWVVYRDNEIFPEAFMSGSDFYVYFPDRQYAQSFCREGLEAAASGALVILPERFKPVHGLSAIYATEQQVPELMSHMLVNRSLYQHRVLAAQQFIRERDWLNDYQQFIHNIRNTACKNQQTIGE